MKRIGMSREGIASGGSAFASEEQRIEVGASGEMMGVSYRQAKRLWKRYREEGAKGLMHGNAGRANREPSRRVTAAGAGAGAEEVWGRGGGAIWADAGGRAFGEEDGMQDGRGNAAAVDVGGRVVEPGRSGRRIGSGGSEGALWGVGANGRKFSRLVGRAGAGGLPDEHGGRCDQGGEFGWGRRRRSGRRRGCCGRGSRNTGCRRRCTRIGRMCMCGRPRAGAAAGRRAGDAVWADVREAGDRDHRGEFAAGQGAGGDGTTGRIRTG